MTRFGSFWHGPRLSAFESACLYSFVAHGHEMTLFATAPPEGLPPGVRWADAREILDPVRLVDWQVGGRPSASHFADAFRYRMQQRTPLTWVDADLLRLRDWSQDPAAPLLARETARSLGTAVLRIPSDAPWLATLIERCDALAGQPLRWGETGPRLLTAIAGHRTSWPARVHFPIHWDEFWKPLLPEHADECRARCRDARTLHLWNNRIEQLGYWKDWLPPRGSFLRERLTADGSESFFQGEFPLPALRQLVENWRARQTGHALGLGGVLRQLLPSAARSWRARIG